MSTTAWNAFGQPDPTTPPLTPTNLDSASHGPAPNTKAKTEPISPPNRTSSADDSNLIVEELSQDDPNYENSLEVLHPDELEEQESSDSETDMTQDTEDSPDSDAAITRRMRHLHTRDKKPPAALIRRRQAAGSSSAAGRKRAHSQSSIGPETDTESVYAPDDQDTPGSARRLRRRVRAPSHYSPILADAVVAASSDLSEQASDEAAGEPMDIDQSSQSTPMSAD